jgi:hypothetical protein
MEHQIRNASPLKREDIFSFLPAHKTEVQVVTFRRMKKY